MNDVRAPLMAALPALDTEEDVAIVVSDALSRGDSALLLEALKALAWTRFITQLSATMGLSRAQLAPMLQGQTPLTLDVAMRLLGELKLTVSVSPSARKPAVVPMAPERPIDASGAAYVRRF